MLNGGWARGTVRRSLDGRAVLKIVFGHSRAIAKSVKGVVLHGRAKLCCQLVRTVTLLLLTMSDVLIDCVCV
jgi:hypothetical protein